MGIIVKMLKTKNVMFNTLFPTFSLIYLVSHLWSCVWHYFSWYSKDSDTWIDRNGYRDTNLIGRYIASFYFVFQTITTVGYGDIGVETKTEFSITIALMFMGVIFYSSILTRLLDLIIRTLTFADYVT